MGLLALALTACGGSSSPTAAPTRAAPTATTAAAPTATTAAAPTATTAAPTATAAATATTANGGGDGDLDPALLADGKVIFEKTGGGGVGCAFCHSLDGKGDGPSGLGAPANRCATRDRLEWALAGGETEAMTYFTLTSHEKDAVLEYLAYLCTQP